MKKMDKIKNKRGITLVALIITIIVILILVGVSIRVVNSDLIGVAENTANAMKTAYAEEGQLSKVTIGGIEYNTIAEYMNQCNHEWEAEVIKAANCSETGIQKKTCTKCGKVEEEIIAETPDHLIENGVCTKCEQTYGLVIGATIVGYDPSIGASGTISTSYTSAGVEGNGTIAGGASGNGYDDQTFTVKSITEWQVLGEEDGQLIITPITGIQTDAGTSYSLRGQAGYTNMIEELNKISSIYGQGKYADISKYSVTVGSQTIGSGGRSINLEDIATLNSTPTTKNYTKNSDDGYIYIDGTKTTRTTFIYWGEDASPSQGAEWKTLGSGESVIIASYEYTKGTMTTKQQNMIFGASKNLRYWLASPWALHRSDCVFFFGLYVYRGVIYINDYPLYRSYGTPRSYQGSSIRPAVYLKSDIQLSYNSETEVYTIIP